MATYHVELRSFPRQCVRFNQSGAEVGAIVLPWVQDRVIEIDGEKWAPYDSQITILEGPPIPLDRLSMGRGWKTAQREGTDVTDRILGEARAAIADGSAYGRPSGGAAPVAEAEHHPAEPAQPSDYPSLSDSPGPAPPELRALLGTDADRLLAAWAAVARRTGGLAPSESLALAERELQREDRDGA